MRFVVLVRHLWWEEKYRLIFVINPEYKSPFEKIRIYEENTEVYSEETESETFTWICFRYERDQGRSLIKSVLSLLVT
jgi:hypothetical protein